MDYNQYPNQQPYYGNQQYQAQPMTPAVDHRNDVLRPGEYVGMFFLSSIPIVRIICWIIWLVSDNVNKNKKNYVIGMIIYSLIITLVSVIAVVIATTVFGFALGGFLDGLTGGYYY